MLEPPAMSPVLISDNPVNRDNEQETAVAVGYLAGMLDGEGSVVMSVCERSQGRVRQLRVTPKVVLTNTDLGIIERCVQCLKLIGVTQHVRHQSARNGKMFKGAKDVHYIEIFGNNRVHGLLSKIGNLLGGEKKQRASILMRFIERRVQRANDFGMANNMRYDKEDLDNILDFLSVTKTKRMGHYRRILNDYTRDGDVNTRRHSLNFLETERRCYAAPRPESGQ